MRTIKKHWLDVSSSPVDSETSPIRQIYVWLLTSDNQLVIVSNDGEHWQLPGGKPSNGEGVLQAANREVYEETGLDISSNSPIFLASTPLMTIRPIHSRGTDKFVPTCTFRQKRQRLR